MLDDLRDFDESAAFLDELEDIEEDAEEDTEQESSAPAKRIFGMTPPQRFLIAFELFVLACILAFLCLLVFNVISPA